ncbi:Protein RTC2 [Ophiocordyceps camponoti-floridani]|uniref:Protein RTC2 n=1 Tax=Ophiocordyceps camponoti-floridani TaxID=2030778 RepID=A0A8H4Q8K2_9HYPO|nr:Protein RTC2 [Ophiocordyceps camponoti-floridani]
MAPLKPLFPVDAVAVSGICGAISIACWVVVFSPQIIQQFRQGNADGLSVQFIAIWLLGDVFNIVGAVLQGTMLAIYYTLTDLVLLGQCFYYRGPRWRDDASPASDVDDERTPLTSRAAAGETRPSDWTGLSPAVGHPAAEAAPEERRARSGLLRTAAWKAIVIAMVLCAGATGWLLNGRRNHGSRIGLEFDAAGQVFGYLSAVAYIASRVPQLLLNWRRKTTDGLSMLFFLFACLGNATYVLSILSYEPRGCVDDMCSPGAVYGRHVLVNLSWLMGSAVTLLMDLVVLAQHLIYRTAEEEEEEDDDDDEEDEEDNDNEQGGGRRSVENDWAGRPILRRGETDNR